MEVTNIKEAQPGQEHRTLSFAKWFVVWLVIYTVVGIVGGLFTSGPKDVPAGMTWTNAADFSSSTFYVLRGGPHLILELNPHSQRWMAMLFTGFAVMFMYVFGQALHGKLKNRQKVVLPPWQQWLSAAVAVAMVVFLLWYGVGNLMKKETLDLDPAANSVQLNGDYISSFDNVRGFRSYITHGSKGSINYHLVMALGGAQEIHIGGNNAHSDVESMANHLNSYLAEVRRPAPSENPSNP